MRTRTRAATVAIAITLGAISLASCGGRTDGGNPGNPAGDTSSTTTTIPGVPG